LRYLRLCIDLADTARGATAPNPLVGAVVVKDGQVLGRGFHQRAGEPHAERLALAEAGPAARGATLYTNMEPCCHQGRTPPCVEAVLAAGVIRVVSSIQDPDPRVDGAGFAALRKAGLRVDVGGLSGEAAALNAGYMRVKDSGRPFVIAKAAMSLDGRLATRTGASQWITGPEARRHAHVWRARVDAVMVGSGTVLADDPRLTARDVDAVRQPRRIILDSRLRTTPAARVFEPGGTDVVVITGPEADPAKAARLHDAGASVIRVAITSAGVDIEAALRALIPLGVSSVMIEGGSAVLTSAFEVGTIDKVLLFYAPLLIGGSAAPSLWGGSGVDTMDRAPRLHESSCQQLGTDWLVEGYVRPLLSRPRAAGR
jgi:diaminohydroxyphosphoribosylaminopyrimidine deaminase/5-amino-6-(5-phosphoribosylamino)uracil reductase